MNDTRREILCRLSGVGAVTAVAIAVGGFGPWSLGVVAAVAALHVHDARARRRGRPVAVSPLSAALPVVRLRRRRDR